MIRHSLSRRHFLQLTATAAVAAVNWRLSRAFAQAPSAGDLPGQPFEALLAGPPQGPWRRLFLDACVLPPISDLGRTDSLPRGRQLWRKAFLMDTARRRFSFRIVMGPQKSNRKRSII